MAVKDFITTKQLKNSRACSKYKELAMKHLGDMPDVEFERRATIKAGLIECLRKDTLCAAINAWDGYMANVYPTLPGVIAQATGDIIHVKGSRFITWLFDQGYRLASTGFDYSFDFEGLTVTGRADMILSRGGDKLFMNIEFGTNPYSDKARKEENATSNSIELLSLLKGGTSENADAAIAYLTSKDDKSGQLVEAFEVKPGKNLAMVMREGVPDVDAAIAHSMGLDCSMKCTDCRMANLCKAKEFVPEDLIPATVVYHDDTTLITDEQAEIIKHPDGPMLVIGAPGTGKTYTIVQSVMNLINHGVQGSRIRVVTFTVNAANEFLDRISLACLGHSLPAVSTIHSWADEIVREIDGVDVASKLAESTDVRIPLIIEALKASPVIKDMSYDFPESRFGLYHRLDGMFVNMDKHGVDVALDGFKGDRDGVLRVYEKYRELFEAGGHFYYDWLIQRATELTSDPVIGEKYRNSYDYLIVDEFQDTTREQFALIKNIVNEKHNVRAFGDDDQCIYQFGGVSSEILNEFVATYPGCKVEYLEENHRSVSKICDTAQMFIEHNSHRFGKVLTTTREEGSQPFFGTDYNNGKLIQFLSDQQSFKPEDIAVLARKNSPLEGLKADMEKAGLKATAPRSYLIDSPEFSYMLMFFTFAKMLEETPKQYMYRLLMYMGITPEVDGSQLYETYLIPEAMPRKLRRALALLDRGGLVSTVISEVFKTLTDCAGNTPAINALITSLDEASITTVDQILPALERKQRFCDTTEVGYVKKPGYFNLITSHKAKGKEWPMVIIYGLDEYGSSEGDDLEAETNLVYVSMTRASDVLVILNRTAAEAPLQCYLNGIEPIRKEA